jgi:hypothetical protein
MLVALLSVLASCCSADASTVWYIGTRDLVSTAPGIPTAFAVQASRFTTSGSFITIESLYVGGGQVRLQHDLIKINVSSGVLTATDLLGGINSTGTCVISSFGGMTNLFGSFASGPIEITFTYQFSASSDHRVSAIVIPQMPPFQELVQGHAVSLGAYDSFVTNIFRKP